LEIPAETIQGTIETPPRPEMGDIASSVSFKIARDLERSPQDIAQELKEILSLIADEDPLLDRIEVVGPYVNFFLNSTEMTRLVLQRVRTENNTYGHQASGHGRKIVVEHTSMNPVKPLHIGNLRNAILGDIVARMYESCGWSVEVQNLIDDLGRQMATLLWGFLKGIHVQVPRQRGMKYDVWLGLVYTLANELSQTTNAHEEIDGLMRKIKEDRTLFLHNRFLAEKCVDSNLETTWRMGIGYDLLIWESDVALGGTWEETLAVLEKNPHFCVQRQERP
jgi:arginyl-tRNA synthetase